ncbi:MAG: DUF5320 family protein [Bacteroidales bacterium]|jgi:hypothetical protein|nr:DUF5320 family protein [Bacteroidales bacterium]NLM92897.1 DUF5320 domain-containing protein [Bacteroidales bacterium]
MPKMNGTGPDGKGPGTGRRLGKCKAADKKELQGQLGQGMGKRRKAGGGEGQGKRLQSGKTE